ncbi:MAG: hypothetical protein ABIF19_17810, partial [Planctomycetota bacterium]
MATGTIPFVLEVICNVNIFTGSKTLDAASYTTGFAYDSADRPTTVTYPTGETVTQTYTARGLPNTLSGSAVGSLVTGMLYNQMGQVTQINPGNGTQTAFGYWDVGGANDNAGGYYGRLWRIQTAGPGGDLQDVRHTWDAGANLIQREDVQGGEIENFGYDFLDRLVSASGPYTEGYTYNQIGNMMSKN